jgi:hypothetical protein
MAANQDTTATNLPGGAADMGSEVQNAFASADQLAAQRIQSLQLVHQARNTRLRRELAVLKAEHAPDDEIKVAEAAVAASAFTASRVAVVHQQLTTPQPEVAANGWALHGRVFDNDLKPVTGFTVFLVDAQKAYQKQFGFDYTDEYGYYLISYPRQKTTPRAGSPPPSRAATQPSPKESSTEPQLLLEVADANAYPVYLSDTPFRPVTGTVTYQNVTLAPGNKPIGDPPQQIRDVAMPPRGKRNR